VTPIAALVVTLAMMLVEQQRSRRNEGLLRARGAAEPTGDVYRTMAWAYPGAFVLMTTEGLYAGNGIATAPSWLALAGVVTFVAAKALKYWAIASLGTRWTFRVLVIPGAPLVAHGPYAVVRHPNYLAVVGEMIGFALLVRAPVTAVISVIGFGLLLRRRISVEECALRT
jgi:methyltransferase